MISYHGLSIQILERVGKRFEMNILFSTYKLYLVEGFLRLILVWCYFHVWCNWCSFILSYWGLCIYKEGGKVLREPSLVRMIWKEGPLKKNMFSFIWKKSIFLSCVFYCNIWGYPDRKALGYCICKSDTITPDIPYIPTCISLQQL